MEAQNSKLLGTLYYDDTERPFVAPPTVERKALNKKRQDDYILAKETTNEIDRILRTLPHLEQSSAIYNELKSKVNEGLSGINADNYADKVLDSQQLANDMMNKYGGTQLIDEAKQMSERLGEIDALQKEGKIVDPEMANWYKQRIAQQHKGLVKDEQGYIANPKVQGVPVADYVDMQALLDERIKGWESDGTIIRNADGSIRVGKDIPGYFNYGEKEFISEDELMQAGMKYLQNDAKVQAYLNDKTAFDTRNIVPDAANLNQLLSPEAKEALLGNADADEADIQLAISSGQFNPNEVLKALQKQRIVTDNSLFTAAKYGYTKEKLNTLSDTLLLEQFKALRGSGGGGAMAEPDTASVTVEHFTTQQILNPKNVKAIRAHKDKLVETRTNAQIALNDYQKGYSEGREGFSIEELEKQNQALSLVDQEIAELDYQEKSVYKQMNDKAKGIGIDFDGNYDKYASELTIDVQKENLKRLSQGVKSTPNIAKHVKFDVTDLVKFKDGKPYIPTWDGEYNKSSNSFENHGIYKEGEKYYVRPTHQSSLLFNGIPDEFITNEGTFTKRAIFDSKEKQKEIESGLVKVPTKEEFLSTVTQAYINGVEPSSWYKAGTNTYQNPDSKAFIGTKVLEDVKKMREKFGDFDFEVARPIDYLLVVGESSKSDLRAFTNGEKALKDNFKITPEQYHIDTLDGQTMDLATYMKETYGLPALTPEYVNMEKSDIYTALETHREFGQKYGITLSLTEKGRGELNDKGEEMYNRSSTLKVVGVNPDHNTKERRQAVQDRVLKAYGAVVSQGTPHSTNIKQEMGRLFIDNSDEGRALDKLNLYTLPAGELKSWDVKGSKYNIYTTAKPGSNDELLNTNFHLTKVSGGDTFVLAVDKTDPNKKDWKSLSEVEADSNWMKYTFETPSDIKAVVGATLLDAEYKNQSNNFNLNIQQQQQQYQQFLQANGYNTINNGTQTISQGYNPIVKKVTSYYGSKPKTISLYNSVTGQNVTINSRVDANTLYDLSSQFPDRIANTSQYNYVNKGVVPYVSQIFNDFPVTMTGGFRGEVTHFGLKESSNNSLHKYAHALDFRADDAGLQFFDRISSDPQALKKYNIISIKKHGDPLHIHVEFAPNIV